jgi:hypothetical protein
LPRLSRDKKHHYRCEQQPEDKELAYNGVH